MKRNDLISVIVPIYKVEDYLRKCLDSILNQSYTNLEIILVDDGSPDSCPQICDEYAKKDTRIKVIHKKNGGLSDARNVGIESSSGKYISLIDSDDYINKYFIETLYKHLIETQSDIAICNYQKVFASDVIDIKNRFPDSDNFIYENDDKFSPLYTRFGIPFVVAWNKLYKAEIFKQHNIRYPLGKIHEDEFVIHELLNVAERVCFFDTPLYNYVIRDGSIMSQKLSEKNISAFDAFVNRILFYQKHNPAFVEKAIKQLLHRLYTNYHKFTKSAKIILKQKFKTIKKQFKAEIKNLSFKEKLKLFIFKYFKFIYSIKYK